MVCTSDSNSGAISARELFKHSKSLASLVVCNEKNNFWFGVSGFFVSDVISEVDFWPLLLMLPGLGPNC